ncbi:MAG: hypothetical protein IKO49_03830 [Bacilli bacterium]|nr:hypothetical protein [Clostridia bacterium]MBR4618416.1 hypothetical protein [Bacilli bacterium]
MLKYRKFISLTDDEISLIVKDMFHPESINYIEKDKKYDEIKVSISTKWYSLNKKNEEEEDLIEDEIILTEDDITADFQITAKDMDLYKKFLFSLGIHDLFKDNPYLKRIETKNNKLVIIDGFTN